MASKSYITFRLGRETFAIDVAHVREVLDMEEVTPLPRAPEHVLGIVNVRGGAIPIVDLRAHFGMAQSETTLQSRILVLEFPEVAPGSVVGGLADAVLEVIELDPADIAPPPVVGQNWSSELIEAVTLREGRFIMLLKVANLFTAPELGRLASTPLLSATS